MDNHKGEQSFVQKMLEEKEAARRNFNYPMAKFTICTKTEEDMAALMSAVGWCSSRWQVFMSICGRSTLSESLSLEVRK
jgi:hypothetical protein